MKRKRKHDKASAPEPNEVEKLQQSFGRVHSISNKLCNEYELTFEARRLSIPVEEYRRLYKLHWRDLTGFAEKKLWDVLQLIIVPLVLAGVAFYLPYTAKQTEQDQTTERNRQESLNKYFDIMTNLLLESKLRTSKEESDVRTIARARTLTTLRGLDEDRKGQLLKFLFEDELINDGKVIVSLFDANLNNANLNNANLSHVSPTMFAFKRDRDPTNLNLTSGTEPSNDHAKAKRREANLSNLAHLPNDLIGSKSKGADLSYVDLSEAELNNANLIETNLSHTKLQRAKLQGANLSKADLTGANLSEANLMEAKNLTEMQMNQAKLCGTILPDGEIKNQDCEELKMENEPR
jgi:uncharacterized protein YjbI with pentapeptide repeats